MTKNFDNPERIPALSALREGFVQTARAGKSSSSSRRHLAAGLAGLSLFIGVAAFVVTNADETVTPGPPPADTVAPPQAVGGAFVSAGPEYRALSSLVANSQAVVVGSVKDVRPGREIVDIDPEYPTRFLNTVLSVDEVLKGSARDGEVTVTTPELAYAGGPDGPDTDWRKPGERMVAFLAPSPLGGSLLVPTTYVQSFYRVDGEDVVPLSPATADPLQRSIGSMSRSALREAVRNASGN